MAIISIDSGKKISKTTLAEIRRQVTDFFSHTVRDSSGKAVPRPLIVNLKTENIDVLTWLKGHEQQPKIYWRGRDEDLEVGGVGATLTISTHDPARMREKYQLIRDVLDSVPSRLCLRFFGGARFNVNSAQQAPWMDFPGFWYVLPELMVCRKGKDLSLNFTILVEENQTADELTELLTNKIEALNFTRSDQSSVQIPAFGHRMDNPDYKGWQNNIRESLSLIHFNAIQKVVMARQTSLRFSAELPWAEVLSRLIAENQNCFVYLFQPRKDWVFFGATPERLFKIDQNVLISEAVSGTMPRGMNDSDDHQLGFDLLHSDKNLREHKFVAESIKKMFDELCDNTGAQPNPRLLKLAQIQHLYSKISGRLKKNISLFDIIIKMHPTPAVGGTPKDGAMRIINELEPFDRGWYAGPVGFISQNEVEIVVALRSLLLSKNRALLFAGAGIVAGSEADLEWQELESKISIPLQIFAGEKIELS